MVGCDRLLLVKVVKGTNSFLTQPEQIATAFSEEGGDVGFK